MLDGEVRDEEWDKNDKKNCCCYPHFDKMGGGLIVKCYMG